MEVNRNEKMAVEHLNAWLDELYWQAEKVVEGHWAAIRATEQKMPGWENKSALRLRCARKGNAIKIEWQKIRWAGSKARGTRKAIREYVRKKGGKKGDDGYSLSVLLRLSKEWEEPIVKDTVKRLTAISKEWNKVNKALQFIRFARDVRKAAMAADKNGGADA